MLLVEQSWIRDGEVHKIGVTLDFTKVNWVVVGPFPMSVVYKERVQQLTWFELWVFYANVCYQNSISDASKIAKNIRINSSIFSPKFDAPQSKLKSLQIGMFLNFVDDAVCDPPTVQRLYAFGIAISEDGVVLKGFVIQIFFNFWQFCSGKQ